MTDIALGQSITGSLTADDPKIGSQFSDDYNLNLDSFRQLIINVALSKSTAVDPFNPLSVALVNSDTGDRRAGFEFCVRSHPDRNYISWG